VTQAFWDSSALVPLCVHQPASATARQLLRQYSVVAWWSTPVEMRSALERLLRTGSLTTADHAGALLRLESLRHGWRELEPIEPIRREAESLLGRYPLKGADALQLAAALTWARGKPRSRTFIASDFQLLSAAQLSGFRVISA
jgi:predicted nucleic acid-binding protein